MIANAGTISNPGVRFSSGGIEIGVDVDVEVGVAVPGEVVGACGSGGSPGPDTAAVLIVPRVISIDSAPLFRSDAKMRCSITADSDPALALNSSTSPSLISFCSGAGFVW